MALEQSPATGARKQNSMIAIQEISTFSHIPSFVPFGVLYYTQDTSDLYIGTGNSIGPAVSFIAGPGGAPPPAGVIGDIQYNDGSGNLGAQAGFNIGPTTGEVAITDISSSSTGLAGLSVFGNAHNDDIQDWYISGSSSGSPDILLSHTGLVQFKSANCGVQFNPGTVLKDSAGSPGTQGQVLSPDVSGNLVWGIASPSTGGGNLLPQIGFTIGARYNPTVVSGTGDGAGFSYTVPAGYRAVCDIWIIAGDGAADTITPEVKLGGTGSWYKLISSPPSTNTNPQQVMQPWATAISSSSSAVMFEAGDVISLNSSAGTGYYYGTIYIFPNTAPHKWVKVATDGLAIGLNTLYTVPGGKHAILGGLSSAAASQLAIAQAPAGSGFSKCWPVKIPSGVTPTGVNLLLSPGSVVNIQSGSTASVNLPASSMQAGDAISVFMFGINSLAIASVAAASGGSTVYTGTITNGGSNAFANCYFYVIGFVNSANNGLYLCTASSTTTLTLSNANGVAETRVAVAAQISHTLSSVAAGTGVYQGLFTGGASGGGLAGYNITISGFTNAANNGNFTITSSTATAITTNNSSSVLETFAGLCLLVKPSAGNIWMFPIEEYSN